MGSARDIWRSRALPALIAVAVSDNPELEWQDVHLDLELMVKKLLVGVPLLLLALVLLMGAGAFLLPGQVTVLHSAQLAASPDVLFELLSTPREWTAWAPWRNDANLKGTVSGPPTGVGARWDWSSDREPGGWLVFTRAIPSATVSFDLRTARFGAAATSQSVMQLAPNSQGTVVQWQLTLDLGNSPIARWQGVGALDRLRREMELAMTELDAFSRDLPPTEPIMGRELDGAQVVPRP